MLQADAYLVIHFILAGDECISIEQQFFAQP